MDDLIEQNSRTFIRMYEQNSRTFIRMYGHLKYRALQKSLSGTWHSSISASTQSRSLNVNTNLGYCGLDGQRFALIRVSGNGSQLQLMNSKWCSMPTKQERVACEVLHTLVGRHRPLSSMHCSGTCALVEQVWWRITSMVRGPKLHTEKWSSWNGTALN